MKAAANRDLPIPFYAEIGSVIECSSGVSLARPDGSNCQWPCGIGDAWRGPVLYQSGIGLHTRKARKSWLSASPRLMTATPAFTMLTSEI